MASSVDQCFQGLLNWRRQWGENVWRGIHRWHTLQNVFRGGGLTPLTRLRQTCQGKVVQVFLRKAVPLPLGRSWTVCVNLTVLRTGCCTGCVPVWLWYDIGELCNFEIWTFATLFDILYSTARHCPMLLLWGWLEADEPSHPLFFFHIYICIYCLVSSFKFILLKTLTLSLTHF